MYTINFGAEFAAAVASGKKRQTIREKTQARVGEHLRLYTGRGTRAVKLIYEAPCLGVNSIILMKTLVQPHGNTCITGIQLEDFAKADGFKTYTDMWRYFEPHCDGYGQFRGVLIRW